MSAIVRDWSAKRLACKRVFDANASLAYKPARRQRNAFEDFAGKRDA